MDTGPAAAYHDRIVVGRALQCHLEFVPSHFVVTDRGHDEVIAGGQADGQFAEPGPSEVLEVILVAVKMFHCRPDVIRRPGEKPLIHRDHAVRPVECA